jgi:transposase
MVELVRSARTPEELAREFEPMAQSIWDWVRQAERDGGARKDSGVASPERVFEFMSAHQPGLGARRERRGAAAPAPPHHQAARPHG